MSGTPHRSQKDLSEDFSYIPLELVSSLSSADELLSLSTLLADLFWCCFLAIFRLILFGRIISPSDIFVFLDIMPPSQPSVSDDDTVLVDLPCEADGASFADGSSSSKILEAASTA